MKLLGVVTCCTKPVGWGLVAYINVTSFTAPFVVIVTTIVIVIVTTIVIIIVIVKVYKVATIGIIVLSLLLLL